MAKQSNSKVRAELGGDEGAAHRIANLRRVWPTELVKHCDSLLKQPMSDTTFEALAAAVEWRVERGVPGYLRPPPRRHPKSPIATVMSDRRRARATSRALWRLKALHPEEFARIYQEERQREASHTAP